ASSIKQLYDYGPKSCPLTEDTATCTNSLEQVVQTGAAFNPATELERDDYVLTKVLRNITTIVLNTWGHPADQVPSDHKPLVSTIMDG
ncbi:MAG TPA: hypothetical protein PLO43_04180, partial [Chlamydiales bacterium]|nr:hypothetical protein [Chlamydiales bacterium]